jgi:outer membrane protein OmpA-like peptidoglycan-associated protein
MRSSIFALIAALLIAGCAPKTTVVLMPDDDGNVGQVVVTSQKDQAVLNTSHASVKVGDSVGPIEEMDTRTVNELFAPAITAQTPAPVSYLLYFQFGSNRPDQPSMDLMPKIIQTITTWPHPEVTVIGHTDTMGDKALNTRLSLNRAETVRSLLVDAGVNPELMDIRAHGENDPLVPTGPNMAEPKNRRVEIQVR